MLDSYELPFGLNLVIGCFLTRHLGGQVPEFSPLRPRGSP